MTRARPGVEVNGQPWQAPIPVGPGDRIRFGAGGVEVLSVGSTVGGSQAQTATESGSGSSLDPSLGSGSAGGGGRVQAPTVGSQVGRYLLEEPLGAGQFGTVFRARDTQLGREVALKLLVRATERAQQRFLREVQATAQLKHPNLVTTYDGGEVEGWLYLAMEVVIGRTLKEAGRDPSVDLPQKVRWIAQSARAVAYVNTVGVLHRDLKPSNIMIDGENQARVVDFGLAGIESEETQRLTKTGAALGTPAYMAPEVLFKGGQEAGPPSEVYGLGASLYSLLTGRAPRLQFNEEPERIGEISPELEPWLISAVEKSMEVRPEDRFQSADDFAEALEAGLGATPAKPRRRLPLVAGLAGGLVLVLGGVGAAVATQADASPTPTATPVPSLAGGPTPSLGPSASPAASTAPVERSPEQRLAAAQAAFDEVRTGEAAWAVLAPRVQELLRAAKDSPEAQAATTQLLLRLYLERGRTSSLRELVSGSPAFATQTDFLAAQVWRALGERERSLATLSKLAGETPETPAARAAAALRCLWLGNPDAARRYLPAKRDELPAGAGTQELEWVAARVLSAVGEQDSARAWLDLVAREDRRLEVAILQGELGTDPGAALKALETRIALQEETSPEAARTLAALAARAKAWPRVAHWLDRIPASQREPRDGVLLGEALKAQGKPEDAAQAWRQAFRRDGLLTWRATQELPDPLGVKAWETVSSEPLSGVLPLGAAPLPRHLAESVASASEPGQAALKAALEASFQGASWRRLRPLLDAALAAAPQDPVVLGWCARLLVGRDRFEQALAILVRAREAQAPESLVERLEAELWLRRGQVDVARRRYKVAAKGDSRDAQVARAELGWLQSAAKEGAALGLTVVSEHETHAPAWLALAVNQINLGQGEEAAGSLERAVALEGGINVRALMFRALLRARGEGSLLARYGAFEQVFGLSDGASPRVLAASVALTKREALVWIRSELSRARAHEPRRPELYLWLGVAGIQEKGQRSEVDRLWRELHRLEPGFRLPASVGQAYQRRFGEAFRR